MQLKFISTLKWALIFCQGFFFFSSSAKAQAIANDSLPSKTSSTLEVNAFSYSLKRLMQPMSVGSIDLVQSKLTDGASLQNALNTIPGVYFESRGNGGSPRLNIRGSMFRSAFGIRNVRMYWEDFALTSPDGTTPMEVIDPNWIHSMDVFKGPSSVQYGNGTGGVVLMKSLNVSGLSFVKVKQLIGQWGAHQQHFTIVQSMPKLFKSNPGNNQRSISIYASRVGTNGYREQEANSRKQVMVVLRKFIKTPFLAWRYSGTFKGENISVFQWYEGGWQLPGSLNQQEMLFNPQQARPFSKANNASLYRRRWMYGSGQNRTWNKWSMNWRLSVNGVSKVNPYGTSPMNQGYKDEVSAGTNALLKINRVIFENNNMSWQCSAGGESQWEDYHIREANNVLGKPGATKYDFNVHYLQFFYYLNTQWRWKDKWVVQAGMAQHQTNAEVNGQFGAANQEGNMHWNPGVTPRWAITYSPFSSISFYTSSSWGFSNPNAFEQVDFQNNRYNAGLLPERGRQLEWGAKWMNSIFEGEITHYSQNMTQLIVPVAVQVDSPLSYNNNASGVFSGWEATLKKNWEINKHHFDCSLSGHQTNAHWVEYASSTSNWSDKRIAGNALHAVSGTLQYSFNDEWMLDFTHFWVDRMPLNNDNSVFSPSYNLTHLKLSQVINGKNIKWKCEWGVNNALNTSYTSFWQWNDANARYFNPAPSRNFYFGITAYLLK